MGPGILISSPQMDDPFFEGTVILLCNHNETGAIGLVINRETTLPMSAVLDHLSLGLVSYKDKPAMWGGPVEPGSGFVIYQGKVEPDEGWGLSDGICVSPSQDRLVEALESGNDLLLCLGYAGWGPEQLDDEIRQGSWLFVDIDSEIILRLPTEKRYDAALAKLGLTSQQIWMKPVDE